MSYLDRAPASGSIREWPNYIMIPSFVLFLYLLINIQPLVTFEFFSGIEITGADIFILLCIIALIPVLQSTPSVSSQRTVYYVLFFLSLFIIWEAVRLFSSPQPVRGLTLIALTIRDLLIVSILVYFGLSGLHMKVLNKAIFLLGVILATIALAMYSLAVADYNTIVSTQSLWKPPISYELGSGGVLRLKGLSSDPNFFSFFILLPTLIGIYSNTMKKSFRIVGVMVMALSLILTFSRTLVFGFLISTVVIFTLNGKFYDLIISNKRRLISSVLLLIPVGILPLPGLNRSVFGLVFERIQSIGEGSRFEMWGTILDGINSHLIKGHGLRAAEEALSGMYTHNSYLTILYETGAIGLIIFLSIILLITRHGLQRFDHSVYRPWVHTWVFLCAASAFFSFTYSPYFWMIAGVLLISISERPI
jgi:O-antigen ligase